MVYAASVGRRQYDFDAYIIFTGSRENVNPRVPVNLWNVQLLSHLLGCRGDQLTVNVCLSTYSPGFIASLLLTPTFNLSTTLLNLTLYTNHSSLHLIDAMATRTIEARFERMSVNDENDPGDGTKHYSKKVCIVTSNGEVNKFTN